MKKTLLITIGAVVITGIFALWVYLLVFGTPENATALFSDFGFANDSAPERTIDPNRQLTDETALVDTTSTVLVQLTTRPVAGFTLSGYASSTEARYVEQGIGHVYDINLTTGIESRVLNKTFTAITDAVFAPDGQAVVLISNSKTNHATYLEEIKETSAIDHELPADAENIAFITNTDLRYTRKTAGGMSGYAYNLITQETQTLFSIPLSDAQVTWTSRGTYVFSNPAPFLRGGLYTIENNTLYAVQKSKYAFSALIHPNGTSYIRTYADPNTGALNSYFSDTVIEDEILLPLTVVPEKCTFDYINEYALWCGATPDIPNRTYQTDWYKGTHTSNDMLWYLDTQTQEGYAKIDFLTYTGRTIDVDQMTIDPQGGYLLFTNKLDNTLWIYNIARGNR